MAEIGDKFIIEIGGIKTLLGGGGRICEVNDIGWLVREPELDKLEKYKPEKKKQEEIRVGDEVIDRANALGLVDRFIVTGKTEMKGKTVLCGIDRNGLAHWLEASVAERTGRYHSFLSDAVKALKEMSR